MKTLTIVLIGVSKYCSNPGLIAAVRKASSWDVNKVIEFIQKNDIINFANQSGDQTKDLFGALQNAGFELTIDENKLGFNVKLNVSYENEVRQIRNEMATLMKRIDLLEEIRSVEEVSAATQPLAEYALMVDRKVGGREAQVNIKQETPEQENLSRRAGATEANIGQYWLSRIGIFTLLLGVVFLITYTSQYLGAWGKLTIGAIAGLILLRVGNVMARDKDYFKWAMAAVGGGWAILYFTVFAAYHVPTVRVIHNPAMGLVLLMVVSVFSIAQSLQYKSYVLVIMSYFLAFVAMITTNVTFYTLLASLLLGLSMVTITRKLGWSWVACLGLLLVYGTHWAWLEPSITLNKFAFDGQERLIDALSLPFIGDQWKIYPVIAPIQSTLHLAFLCLYWLLFSAMDFSQPEGQRQTDKVTPWLAVANSLIFTVCFIHHLHVYFPDSKYVFTAIMAVIFFVYFRRENKLGRALFSDVYLGMSASLACLIIPMYFEGSSVTFGWAAASAVLLWLSIKYNRLVLRVIAGTLSVFVMGRLVIFDYLERENLFSHNITLNPFFFISLFSAGAFLVIAHIYKRASKIDAKEKSIVQDTATISAATIISIAVLMGGKREVSSFAALCIGSGLMLMGLRKLRISLRVAGAVMIFGACARYMLVDFNIKFLELLINNISWIRYASGVAALAVLLVLAEKLRAHDVLKDLETKYYVFAATIAGLMYLSMVSDSLTDSYRSILWGGGAFGFLMYGFRKKEKAYRWIGLGGFAFVLMRLFLHDFAQLEMIFRILSFMGLGAVLIVASLIYAHYAKRIEEAL